MGDSITAGCILIEGCEIPAIGDRRRGDRIDGVCILTTKAQFQGQEVGTILQPGIAEVRPTRGNVARCELPIILPSGSQRALCTLEVGQCCVVRLERKRRQAIQREELSEIGAGGTPIGARDDQLGFAEQRLIGRALLNFIQGRIQRFTPGVGVAVLDLGPGIAIRIAIELEARRLIVPQEHPRQRIDHVFQHIAFGFTLAGIGIALPPRGTAQYVDQRAFRLLALRLGHELQQGVLYVQRIEDQHQAVGVAEIVIRIVGHQQLDVRVTKRRRYRLLKNVATHQWLILDKDLDVGPVVNLRVGNRRGLADTHHVELVARQVCLVRELPAEKGLHRIAEQLHGLGTLGSEQNGHLVVEALLGNGTVGNVRRFAWRIAARR
ncbi:hypothetical protein BZL42_09605 [Pseudomonas indica]|nr:hypothetical protein BZL42_09605 [Pseudomonas indica]